MTCLNEEQAKRLVRIETRLTDLARWLNQSPGKSWVDECQSKVAVVDGALMVSGPEVSLGAIALAANSAHLRGATPLYVGSNYWGEIHV